MKSDYDIKTDVYKALLNSPIKGAVSGELKKTKRPINSDKEDIVISVLANRTAQKQEAFVNVNVYVKDLDIKGQYEENGPRIGQLCQLCFQSLMVRDKDFRLSVDTENGQQVIDVDGGWHMINNKVLYQIIND